MDYKILFFFIILIYGQFSSKIKKEIYNLTDGNFEDVLPKFDNFLVIFTSGKFFKIHIIFIIFKIILAKKAIIHSMK